MLFKVLDGDHNEGGRTYEKGEVITSSRHLDQIFRCKFERLDVEAKPTPTPSTPQKAEERDLVEDKPVPAPKKKPAPPKKGILVNEQFKFDPVATGLQVFKVGGKFNVYDIDNLEEPLNPKPLTKAKVQTFLDEEC